MRYTKPWLPIDEQAARLRERGLIGDPAEIARILTHVSYYRLTGYLYPFKQPDNTYMAGTTSATVWRRYVFDRQLRLLVLDAIERIEVSIRRATVDVLAEAHGPFPDFDSAMVPHLSKDRRQRLINTMTHECQRSRTDFIAHFFEKYGQHHALPPVWMVMEVVSLGTLVTVVEGLPRNQREAIAQNLGVRERVLVNWLKVMLDARNICAHHGRLWNRALPKEVAVPVRLKESWQGSNPTRVGGLLLMLRYGLTQCAPQSGWHERIESLLAAYQDVPHLPMGLASPLKEIRGWQAPA